MTEKILITAGPTREYIDPVRFLSNDSSGQMGFALAGEAKHLGMDVTLISGPVSLATPKGVKRIDVVSAREMEKEVLKYFKRADVVIMAAAVADYRPKKFSRQKIKKTDRRSSQSSIELIENPDILAKIGRKKRTGQIIVGFALETNDLEKNALKKLKEKNCDWIIANHAKAIGARSNRAIMINKVGRKISLPFSTKAKLSSLIFANLLQIGPKHH